MNEANLSGPLIDRDAAAALIEPLTDLVIRAGAAILAVNRLAMRVDGKQDGSPLTDADLAADRIIAEGLARLVPAIPVVSEERMHLAKSPHSGSFLGSFFLIDPLDGTKEYISGRDEFTVNLALVTDGTPLLGIIGAPALGLIWRGLVGKGAQRLTISGSATEAAKAGPAKAIHTRRLPQPGHDWVAAVSRSHGDARTEAFIEKRPGATRMALGSAVKFGRVAEGCVDIYPRLAPTSEWDIAAGHAIVTAAGGKVTDGQGAALRFGAGARNFIKDFIVPEFIAWGDPAAAG
jgi:3'(2'), 5'-bisphosphate nucleotidase